MNRSSRAWFIAAGLAFVSGLALADSQPAAPAFPNPSAYLESLRGQAATAQSRAQSGQTWTILVYLHGDNNLYSSALLDMIEMQQVGSSDSFRIVVQLDAPAPGEVKQKELNGFNGALRGLVAKAPGQPQTYNDLNNSVNKLQILERIPEPNSDDPRTLAEFVNWGLRRFPAQHYGLVLWDHGGGWDGGYGNDQTDDADGSMASWQVRQGIQAGMAQAGLRQWDFLGFDTCLMGSLELLTEYGDLTKLYIASPEIDYGDGWDYTPTFSYLKDNPGSSMRDFGRQEVTSFNAQHSESQSDLSYRAHAAYDTGQLPALRSAANEFVTASLATTDRAALLTARAGVVDYRFDSQAPNRPRPYVDIGQYAQLVARSTTDSNLARAANALSAAVTQTIIGKSIGSSKQGAFGLSVWLPNDPTRKPGPNTLQAYGSRLQSGEQLNWKFFIDRWFGNITASVQPVDVRITQTINLLEPTDREPAVIGFNVAGNATLIYGELGVVGARNSLNVYGHLYLQPGGTGQYEYNWDGRWYEVSGANGSKDFYSGFFQKAGDSVMYANATYMPPGKTEASDVIVSADLKTGKITAVLDNSSIAPRDLAVQPGGTLRFQLLERNQLTEETAPVPTGRFVTIPKNGLEGMALERNRMPIGEYALIFGARDAAGNIRTGFAPVQIR